MSLRDRFEEKNKKGLTLVEVVVAMAIIGIIAMSFLTAYGSGVTNIFNMGHRTRAIAEARSITDVIASNKDASDAFIDAIYPSETFEKATDLSDLKSSFSGHRVRYLVEEETYTINGQNFTHDVVTILIFYDGPRQRFVTLSVSVDAD